MSLQNDLVKLVDDAEAAYPHPVKVDPPLSGGLNINLRKLSPDEIAGHPDFHGQPHYLLTLWRYKVTPSIQEWNTVTVNLGYLVPIIRPKAGKYGDKFTLQGHIPAKPPEPHTQMMFVSEFAKTKKPRRP